MNLEPLTGNMVLVTLAMLKATDFLVHETVSDLHDQMTTAFEAERQRRGLSELTLYSGLQFPERIAYTERFPRGEFTHDPSDEDVGPFDLTGAPDNEVRFFYGLGAEVADFSCLGRGIRAFVEQVWQAGSAELERRGIEHEFFCDLEL